MKTKIKAIQYLPAVIVFLLMPLPGFSQTGTIGSLSVEYTKDNLGIAVQVYDISLSGLKNKTIFYSFMLRQNKSWIDESWIQEEPFQVPYENALLKGLTCSFPYSFEFLKRVSDLDLPYRGYFFIMNYETNDIIASKSIDFTLDIKVDQDIGENQTLPLSDELAGQYQLEINNNPYIGFKDRLIIKNVTDTNVIGEIWIDWEIGAQARLPEAWERIYILPFTAKREGNTFHFKIIVGKNSPRETEYTFTLYFTAAPSPSVPYILKGTVRLRAANSGKEETFTLEGKLFAE